MKVSVCPLFFLKYLYKALNLSVSFKLPWSALSDLHFQRTRPNLTQPIIKRRDTGQFSVLWFQQLLTSFSVLWSSFLFTLSRTIVRFPYFYTVSFSSFVVMTHSDNLKSVTRTAISSIEKQEGAFWVCPHRRWSRSACHFFYNNRKQCSIYITFRQEEKVTWPFAPLACQLQKNHWY